jgi:ubiquinone/menaquinone biosynthesis C-methylase UbiE
MACMRETVISRDNGADSCEGGGKRQTTERLINIETILSLLSIEPGQVIVEAGCGEGYMIPLFLERCGHDGLVYALEQTGQCVEALRAKYKGQNCEIIMGDITAETQIPAQSVDVLYLSAVVHCFSERDRESFAREVDRLMKPGGTLAIVELDKRETPIGPSLEHRISPEELLEYFPGRPSLVDRAGEFFYLLRVQY